MQAGSQLYIVLLLLILVYTSKSLKFESRLELHLYLTGEIQRLVKCLRLRLFVTILSLRVQI